MSFQPRRSRAAQKRTVEALAYKIDKRAWPGIEPGTSSMVSTGTVTLRRNHTTRPPGRWRHVSLIDSCGLQDLNNHPVRKSKTPYTVRWHDLEPRRRNTTTAELNDIQHIADLTGPYRHINHQRLHHPCLPSVPSAFVQASPSQHRNQHRPSS